MKENFPEHFNIRTQQLLHKAGKLGYGELFVFELDLTYFIPLPLGVNVLMLNDIEMLASRQRTLIISHEKDWANGINIHGKNIINVKPLNSDAVEYTSEISKLSIGIEMEENEINAMRGKKEKHSILLQDVMHSLRNKIIEQKGVYIDTDVDEYGMQRTFIIKFDETKHLYSTTDFYITPSYNYKEETVLPIGDLIDTDKHSPAVLFAHKCEIAYQNHENYDCVLYAAIAIESFANELLRGKVGLYEQFYSPEKKPSELSFYKLICLLEEEGIISHDIRKTLLDCHNRISNVRNSIVHGKATDIRMNRQNAEEAYTLIVQEMSFYLQSYYQNLCPAFRIVKR